MHGRRANRSSRFGKHIRSLGTPICMIYCTDHNPCNSKMTNTYEGSLIRLFRRLEELLRQMAQAGKVMGSEELSKKFEESLKMIKRDIVAAQSLYL